MEKKGIGSIEDILIVLLVNYYKNLTNVEFYVAEAGI